jgi:drug/metabolite transporter (DMT)-like permease
MLALAEAFLVTFLWSTSYILIKIGVEEINPLAFASYRYIIASFALIVPALTVYKKDLTNIRPRQASIFLALGFTGYFIAQGLQFVGLYYLSPVTVTFILNLTPVYVLVFSTLFIGEKPSTTQLLGIVLTLFGIVVFFYGSFQTLVEMTGLIATLLSGLGWAAYMILSRYYLRKDRENVIVLTTCSMSLGSLMLLGTTLFTGNLTSVSANGWVIIFWLSIVNTAFAFALWNHALKTLKVYEQSVLQNTMLIQITLMSVIFIQEQLTLQKIFGMAIVFIGVLIVQLKAHSQNET